MNYQDVVSNVKVYGFEDAVKGAKYSYATDINKVSDEVTKTTESLACSPAGSGHDQFMTGIVVQFDLTFSNKAWVEAERYKFLNFVSSQSTMHRITKFNLDEVYMEYTDPRIVTIMKEKVAEYNGLMKKIAEEKEKGNYLYDLIDDNDITFLIGPEGGFSEKEIDFLVENGFKCCSLSDNILRAESAGMYFLSVIDARRKSI